jgi:hypothetical protein
VPKITLAQLPDTSPAREIVPEKFAPAVTVPAVKEIVPLRVTLPLIKKLPLVFDVPEPVTLPVESTTAFQLPLSSPT